MPTERWHRLGLTALILALGAPLLALLRDRLPKRFAFTVSAGACVLVAILVGVFVEFPNSPIWWRVAQGALVVASTAAYALAARDVALWSAWICFAVLAVLAERSGFASMALMCGATSAAAFASAAVLAIAPRLKSGVERVPIGGALALVLGALSSVVASCGRAYDSTRSRRGCGSARRCFRSVACCCFASRAKLKPRCAGVCGDWPAWPSSRVDCWSRSR